MVDLTVDELEDVVEDEERAALGHELESLGVAHGALLLINQQLAGDQDQHTAVNAGLGIEGRDLVLDLLEGKTGKLLDNGGSALGSRGLESQHGLLAVEGSELLSVAVELGVVKGHELLRNFLKVGSHLE